MKKFLSLFLALAVIVLMAGVGFATNVPKYVNPYDGEAEAWITEVHFANNTALPESLSAGDIVVWDISSSTGDDNNWVTSTTTADTHLVAGVVLKAIASGASGSIIIRGVANADVKGTVAAGDLLCTSTTRGELDQCSLGQSDPDAVGFATEAGTDTRVQVFLFGR